MEKLKVTTSSTQLERKTGLADLFLTHTHEVELDMDKIVDIVADKVIQKINAQFTENCIRNIDVKRIINSYLENDK